MRSQLDGTGRAGPDVLTFTAVVCSSSSFTLLTIFLQYGET